MPSNLQNWSFTGSQEILDSSYGFLAKTTKQPIWTDSLLLPTYFACFSVSYILIHFVANLKPVKRTLTRLFSGKRVDTEEITIDDTPFLITSGWLQHVQTLGGPQIFVFRVMRLTSCLALVGLSTTSLVFETRESPSLRGGTLVCTHQQWLHLTTTLVYAYASVLAFVAVCARLKVANAANNHLVLLMFIFWATYAYRDLYPLATFELVPVDVAEGWILWAKVGLLSFASIIIPLNIPTQYTPFDPKEPAAEINTEQTASLFSLLLWSFLDPLIFKASKTAHLPASEFPPVADYDLAKNLKKRAFAHLNPSPGKKRRHLFWGLVRIHSREWATIIVILVVQTFVVMAKATAINRLLTYLEEDGKHAYIRPWVWVLGIFLAPFAASILMQWNIFLSTHCLVRTEAIITQLVFEHALKIRMKAETSDSPQGRVSATDIPEPEGAEGRSDSTSQEGDETVVSSTVDTASETGKHTQSTESESTEKSANLVGKINNMVTTDLNNVVEGRSFLMIGLSAPLQIGFCIYFLYMILGWSALVGFVTLVFLLPLPGYVAKFMQTVQQQKMKLTDARVGAVTETMSVIRMIKLFGWERRTQDKLTAKRDDELKLQRKRLFLELLNNSINFMIPMIVMIVTFACYTLIMRKELTASRVFSAMAVLDVLRDNMFMVFGMAPDCVQAKVSLDRIGEFLYETELLDEFTSDGQSAIIADNVDSNHDLIGLRNAAFTWANEVQLPTTPGSLRRNFTLRVEEELLFKKGKFNVIYGPTGSGKTSLLMALLGELHFIPSGPDSWFNLPREGGVAYAAQESWVQNETIKDNILFGSSYNETRYNKVIYQCGLARDLTLFEAGDNTEVGEKGLSLSGGQKARLTLARAIYSLAEILILDDVLAALDVHTARWIIEKCFQGDIVRGRTVILVTHNVAITSPIADFAVSLGSDGRLLSQGTISIVLKADKFLSAEIELEKKEVEIAEEVVDEVALDFPVKQGTGKLILAEEISEGRVTWTALKLLLMSMGGANFATFWIAVVSTLALTELLMDGGVWFLSYWSAQYDQDLDKPVPVAWFLGIYSILLVSSCVVYAISIWIHIFGSMRASRNIHKTLIQSILGTTLRWLDSTPVSRVISRCTQDIQAVDGQIPRDLNTLLDLTLNVLTKFGAVVLFTPAFAFPGIAVALAGVWYGQMYMKAQLCVKREMSNARSPVLSHFGAAIAGIVSIRAYRAQDAFRKESLVRIDRYTRSARTYWNLNRWICLRIDILGALFTAALAAYFVYRPRSGHEEGYAAKTGFSLNMAVGFSSMILWWVRFVNRFEVSANSLERIQQYITIEQEEKPVPEGVPPAYWPASGDIRVEGLSASYTPDGPRVLHDVSFHIASGERVGVVGRTGSSKSTLTLALLRCITTSGSVYFDNLDTSKVNLDALRSSVTIIPQIPELLSGTLRENLDPFYQHDDATLNDALRSAGLFSVQDEADEGRITLESAISSGGGNLSVGQRQILALARAIVRRSKLLILDEATSAIDYETDAVIQESLRHGLGNDVTLFTIAHRLQTIMDADKIMVLDAGRIVEFGKPSELLQISGGRLRGLVDESADKDVLHQMAHFRARSNL